MYVPASRDKANLHFTHGHRTNTSLHSSPNQTSLAAHFITTPKSYRIQQEALSGLAWGHTMSGAAHNK